MGGDGGSLDLLCSFLEEIFLVSMDKSYLLAYTMLVMISCAISDDDIPAEDRGYPDRGGYPDYDTWNPAAKPSTPDVILIKQKEPSWSSHHHGPSLGELIKEKLPLLAILAPLAAAAVLLPLKAYLGPLVIYPPVTAAPPAAPAARLGKKDGVRDTQSLAAQILSMIDDMDKAYGKKSKKNA